MMNEHGKSDKPIVPEKPSNKTDSSVAERVEGSGLAKGNTDQQNAHRTQGRNKGARHALGRVRRVAKQDKEVRFTALLHHVTPDRLRAAFLALRRDAAPGVDGETWQHYAEEMEERIQDLHRRVHQGAYRAKPSRRVLIPKPDGRQRPLGIATLEDKIVQRAVVEVLNAVYEEDFLGFSYGFRPSRSPHHALDALATGILRKKVNWVLDADIRGFFDAIDHGCLMRFLKHRIGDRRILRLIQKWLRAGIVEDGRRTKSEMGTPQGATISPLLANGYLHYVFDLWANQWRRQKARGDVIIVRFADDIVVGFEHRDDAERFRRELRDRLAKFCLELNDEKTRLVEFGRYAAIRRRERGLGKPETFDFLGFTHICGKTRAGRFMLWRKTMRTRMRAKLNEVKAQLMRRRHLSIPQQGAWLGSVVRGHFAYYGVPTNIHSLSSFRTQAVRHWRRALRRRSQRTRMNWSRMARHERRWIPTASIQHPWPEQRFDVRTQGRSPVR
jgi:group II intron reverse transcriptase/maturase